MRHPGLLRTESVPVNMPFRQMVSRTPINQVANIGVKLTIFTKSKANQEGDPASGEPAGGFSHALRMPARPWHHGDNRRA
jgi:hypothetical protein